jgi:hypothetical protein
VETLWECELKNAEALEARLGSLLAGSGGAEPSEESNHEPTRTHTNGCE